MGSGDNFINQDTTMWTSYT